MKSTLKSQGKVMVNIVKDVGEVLVSTSYKDLHKHGYKPFMRWGVLKETYTAACILESGILERARKTGKLHIWDPFCGSGSFLIESLMMLLQMPCRQLEEEFPFQNWPIHDAKMYEAFLAELESLREVASKDKIDTWIIGSDISAKAVDAAKNNIDLCGFDSVYLKNILEAPSRQVIQDPLIL